jgi:glutaredoxin 3
MAKIEMYYEPRSPYCARANLVFKQKGIEYTAINVQFDGEKRTEMKARSNRTSAPQIFINEQHVGGSDELVETVQSDKFDQLLSLKTASAPIVEIVS